MINQTEREERDYLEEVKKKLITAIQRTEDRVRLYSEELKQNKQYIYEHQSGMDEADKVAAGQSINRMASTGDSVVAKKKKLIKLIASPYFGRIDFRSGERTNPIYIGIHTFTDEDQKANLVFDWRAPISSMFYDFELGEAWYKTPSGKIAGQIALKRQYKIREGQMEFMIENNVHIHDDLLQKELSKSSDDKMKNIVATIQRDQNAVIRNETASVMIIQGVAGSGKTSIALHRIAFLLYRFREDIAAKDVLIISPNKVFADYISNVLPELGEDQIPEMGMEELANDVLEEKFLFQTFFEQVSSLLETHDEKSIERIQFKSTFEFLSKLNQYIVHLENNFLTFFELRIGNVVVPFPFIEERFKAYHRVPLLNRAPEVIKDIQQFVRNAVQRKLSGNEKNQIWQAVPRMFKTKSVLDIYRGFYTWIDKPELFKMLPGEKLEYADVFPLIYCKIRLEGAKSFDHVKHLLVDEMQDYTPVQYSVLSRLFRCKKTILGDVNQMVNPYSSSSSELIEQVFPQGDVVKLVRSYRSTVEISNFAQTISRNPDLIPLERHGQPPLVKGFSSNKEELEEIKDLITNFKSSKHPTLGIICKTQQQAEFVYGEVQSPGASLLTAESTSFKEGVIITTAHLAKGLEFDEVIIPFVSANNYQTDVDKRMLYIACTRAMHHLTLTYAKEKSIFIID
ncbi:MAG: AAA family ATPase [Cytophagales bacterium]|nr:AAA family ATPase [Cytophagales bacterium]MCA6368677.1 AAA family ATPase [Cytophagales bacterium]MCA6370790.1 AAA family ATPase [Cytophagales bacterium]MCA6376967.1 AAA family ATPase [Cytophagales bacterium]MCA6383130.1 AAA family ATPase [Cytophagales bacterium]